MRGQDRSTRRGFLGTLGGASMISAASSARDLVGPQPLEIRREVSFLRRVQAALLNKFAPLVPHPRNGDEARYPNSEAFGGFTFQKFDGTTTTV